MSNDTTSNPKNELEYLIEGGKRELVSIGTLLAFALSVVLIRLLASCTRRGVFLDHPNERSLHASPVPRSGGIAANSP